MKKKFLLYLTDEEVTLYKGANEKLYTCKENLKDAQQQLQNVLSNSPKVSLRLLIDRNHQSIQEEKLPFLLPWDRMRFLSHKKAEWQTQGGYVGFHFFKQKREAYFRWVHVSQKDSLISWLSWVKSLPNPSGGIFFVPLEAGIFLKKTLSVSNNYQMILYPLSSAGMRHVIFKGNRLLLSRLSQGEEDLKSSLHFLSRTYPDIHESLDVLSLIKETPSFLPHVKILSDPQALLSFLSAQKRPSLSFSQSSSSSLLRLRVAAGVALLSMLFLTGYNVYQGLDYKRKVLTLSPEIGFLKDRVRYLNSLLKNTNVPTLRTASEHYHYLRARPLNPIEAFEKLSFLLKKQEIHLENLRWLHGQKLEIMMSLVMEDKIGEPLATHFERFLLACKDLFPKSQIHVIKGPFNSSIREIFKTPSPTSLPLAQIKIIFP